MGLNRSSQRTVSSKRGKCIGYFHLIPFKMKPDLIFLLRIGRKMQSGIGKVRESLILCRKCSSMLSLQRTNRDCMQVSARIGWPSGWSGAKSSDRASLFRTSGCRRTSRGGRTERTSRRNSLVPERNGEQ